MEGLNQQFAEQGYVIAESYQKLLDRKVETGKVLLGMSGPPADAKLMVQCLELSCGGERPECMVFVKDSEVAPNVLLYGI